MVIMKFDFAGNREIVQDTYRIRTCYIVYISIVDIFQIPQKLYNHIWAKKVCDIRNTSFRIIVQF